MFYFQATRTSVDGTVLVENLSSHIAVDVIMWPTCLETRRKALHSNGFF